MSNKLFAMIPGLSHDELLYLQNLTAELPEEEMQTFASIYNGKRVNPETILIGVLAGFLVVGGIQRFMVQQIGMGILYLLTGGLCFIGTIVDLVNYKNLTFERNQQVAQEALQITIAMRPRK